MMLVGIIGFKADIWSYCYIISSSFNNDTNFIYSRFFNLIRMDLELNYMEYLLVAANPGDLEIESKNPKTLAHCRSRS